MGNYRDFRFGNRKPVKGNCYYNYALSTTAGEFILSSPVTASSLKLTYKLGNLSNYHYLLRNGAGIQYIGQGNEAYRWDISGEPLNPFGWVGNTSGTLFNPVNDWIVTEYIIVSPTQHRILYYYESNPSNVILDRTYNLVNGSVSSFTVNWILSCIASEPAMIKQIQVGSYIWDLNELWGNTFYSDQTLITISANETFINQSRVIL